MPILNPDELRRNILEGIQYVLDHPVRFWLTDEQKRVLKSQRGFWESATKPELDRLYSFYSQQSGEPT